MVAHERLAVAADRGSLGGQPHHEVDHADAVGAAVGEVAEEPQARGPGGPVARGVEEALFLERGDQLVEVAVHVAHDVQRTRPVGGLGPPRRRGP